MSNKNNNYFNKSKIWKIACLILIVLILLLRFYFGNNSAAAEFYIRNIYPTITTIWRASNNFIPFSFSEIFVVLLPIIVIVLMLKSVIKIFNSKSRKDFFRKNLKKFASVFLVVVTFFVSTFFLNLGFSYHRNSLAENLEYEVRAISVEHLAKTTEVLVNELNLVAKNVTRDTNEQFVPEIEIEELLKSIHLEYEHLAEISNNSFLKKHLYHGAVRLKPVMLSHYWSYTGTTGMFMPFWMESNVNVDISIDELIFTALHEIAHSYGFARENEANFLAFLVGRSSEALDIRYSALLSGFVYLSNALYTANYDLYQDVYSELNENVKVDLHRRNVYWRQFQGPVKKISNKANDIYLKSNAQESGIKSYGEVVDLIVAFYDNLEDAN